MPSLALPPVDSDKQRVQPMGLEALGRDYASVKLFSDRAGAIRPAFAASPSAARSIVDICHRLDGIPLAIELAAARIKSLSVEQISARLTDRFRLLTDGCRSALPRHQTLLALVDWSYDLLTKKEQLLLCHLSVFVGGFTLEAAEDVCAGCIPGAEVGNRTSTQSAGGATDLAELPEYSELNSGGAQTVFASESDKAEFFDAWEVMDILAELVEKSLVFVYSGPAGENRYGMLETIRQYSSERLGESGLPGRVQRRHCHSFLQLTAGLSEQMTGSRQKQCLQQLDIEHENLRAALAWSVGDHEPPETAMRFCGAMGRFWVYRGHYREGSAWCGRARNRATGRESLDARALVDSCSGTLAMMQGDIDEAYRFHEESLARWREDRNQRGIARALERLGMLGKRAGHLEESCRLLQESIALSRETGEANLLVVALINLGCLELELEYPTAHATFEECLSMARATGNGTTIALALANLGNISSDCGDFETARLQNEECLSLMREVGDKGGIAVVLHNLGAVVGRQGDLDRGYRLTKEAVREWQDMGNKELILQGVETIAG